MVHVTWNKFQPGLDSDRKQFLSSYSSVAQGIWETFNWNSTTIYIYIYGGMYLWLLVPIASAALRKFLIGIRPPTEFFFLASFMIHDTYKKFQSAIYPHRILFSVFLMIQDIYKKKPIGTLPSPEKKPYLCFRRSIHHTS